LTFEFRRLWPECGRDGADREQIEAKNMECIRTADTLSPDLQHGTRLRDLGACRQPRVERLVEAAARPDDLEVGRSRQGAQTATELRQGGLVDRLHRHAQRDPQHDGGEGQERRRATSHQ
jgi:hypothetical protein